MRKKNSSGFSLVETIIAMAIVAVIMSSTFYLIQSQSNNLIFSKEYFERHHFNVNSYSQLYIIHKVENINSLEGEANINNNKVKWQSSFQPTMLDNIYQFELNIFSDDEVNYKKSKTDLYFYGIIK